MALKTIQIIEKNIKYLNSCLDLTEAHITWGTKDVREKYRKVKNTLLNKIKEEKIYLKEYTESIPLEEEYNKLISELSKGYGVY